MRYLKTYENLKSYLRSQFKPEEIDTIKKTEDIIDDAMSPFLDDGFILQCKSDSQEYWDILRIYTKHNPNYGSIAINGTIKDGKISYGDNSYNRETYGALVEELKNALSVINGMSDVDINFNFSNFYKEDKIILNVKL